MMESTRKNLHLSKDCMDSLTQIMEQTSAKSVTAAIELAAAAYSSSAALADLQAATNHQLELIKKHVNELRRNNYIIIALLNAMVIDMDISMVPMHHEKQLRSPALTSAHENLSIYLSEVMTKISENDAKRGIDDE